MGQSPLPSCPRRSPCCSCLADPSLRVLAAASQGGFENSVWAQPEPVLVLRDKAVIIDGYVHWSTPLKTGCLGLAGMVKTPRSLGLAVRQRGSANLPPLLIQLHPAGLQAASTKVLSGESCLGTLRHSAHSQTAAMVMTVVLPIGMLPIGMLATGMLPTGMPPTGMASTGMTPRGMHPTEMSPMAGGRATPDPARMTAAGSVPGTTSVIQEDH